MADAPTQRNRGGRPKLDPTDPDRSVDMHLSVPARGYDKLYHLARARGVSIPELLRRALRPLLTATRDPGREG